MRALAFLLLASMVQSPDRGAPRKPADIDGLSGFTAVSTIVFASAPDLPHELEATYSFPDRARWTIVPHEGRADQHRVYFRSGPLAFELEPGSPRSRQVSGEGRLDQLRRMELRRAAMLFPEGFEWKKSDEGRRADLGELGHLEAVPAKGEPTSISSFDATGKLRETFDGLKWSRREDRTWPASFRLVVPEAGGVVWTETIRSVDTKQHFVDRYFLPPDRRDLASTTEVGGRKVRYKKLERVAYRRERLPQDADWPDVFDLCAASWQAWSEELEPSGLALSDRPAVELSASGRPQALLLFLRKTPPGDLPEPFRASTATEAFTLFLPEGAESVSPEAVRKVRGAVPEGRETGVAFVLVDRKKDPHAGAQLVLPLEAGH